MNFKPWLRQVINALHRDGALSNTDITGIIVSKYEDVEELFEHGLGSQLVAQLLTEDLYDQENEDGGVEAFGDSHNENTGGGDEASECEDDDPDDDEFPDPDDDEFPEEENIDNQTSEPNEDDDEGCSDGYGHKTVRFFDNRFASVTLLKSEHTILLLRIFRTVHLI